MRMSLYTQTTCYHVGYMVHICMYICTICMYFMLVLVIIILRLVTKCVLLVVCFRTSPSFSMYNVCICVHYTLQVDVYAYNLTEEIWDNLQSSLQKNLDWLKLRHGLLQHVVLQKMGLFDHTEAEDMEPWTSVSYLRELVSMYTTCHVGGSVGVHYPPCWWECGCALPAMLVGVWVCTTRHVGKSVCALPAMLVRVCVSVYILKTSIFFFPTFTTCRYGKTVQNT